MKSIQKINVDISRDRNLSEPSVYAKQNDSNSREVEVTLYDNGVQLSSLTTTGKVFFGKGANAYGEAIEISNGVTEFTIPQNALSSPGRIQAEILILNADDDTETLTSASFIINCRTQINPSGSVDGENKGDYIDQIVDDLQSQIDTKIEQVNGLTGKSITLFSDHIKVAHSSGETSTVADEFETVYSAINRNNNSTNKDIENLQSQIDALGGVDVTELQSQIDTAKTDISTLKTKDTNLQYQIDTDKADIAELKAEDNNLQSQIDTANTDIVEIQESVHNLDMELGLTKSNLNKVEARMGSWAGSGTLYDMVKADKTDISALKTKDTDLQSQINTKATRKVAIVGSDTANSAGWYKVASGTMTKWTSVSLLFAVHTPATSGKHSGILQLDLRGGTEAIEIGDTLKLGWLVRAGFDLSQVIVVVDGYDWALYYKVQSYQFFRAFFEVIQESNDVSINKVVYTLYTDSVVETTAPVATATSTDLGTVNTANKLTTARNINGIAFDGSADINITANDIASTSGPEHNLAYEIGMTRADLSAVEAKIGTWHKGETISDTISEQQKSTLDLDYKVTSTQTDLNAVKARIGSWSTGKTLYDMIADLTARIEALENSASS